MEEEHKEDNAREVKHIKLPMGYEAKIITFWTWGERQEIKKIVLKNSRVEMTPEGGQLINQIMADSVDGTIKTLALGVKALFKDGVSIPVGEKAIYNLPYEVGEALKKELNKLEKDEEESIKKN